MLTCTVAIPAPDGSPKFDLVVKPGSSIVFIGANGSGKTRLGAYLEELLPLTRVQRIAAQKVLNINDELAPLSFERAQNTLRFGTAEGNTIFRTPVRWQGKPSVALLNDFDALLQTLFAEQTAVAVQHLKTHQSDRQAIPPTPKLRVLEKIWEKLLPFRKLDVKELTINVVQEGMEGVGAYPGSEMSDGERAIFYFVGQCLVAPPNAILIVDEPETHIHKGILGALWDSVEAVRTDCSFIYMTHDLDFAASRSTSLKYFIVRSQRNSSWCWDIQPIPEDTGIPDRVVYEILGARKPILFVEGDRNSIDLIVYKNIYEEFLVVPVGSCEHVIHSVRTYKNNAILHRLGDVRGIIDADDRTPDEIRHLEQLGIFALRVAEIENIFALPDVFMAMATMLMCPSPCDSLDELKKELITRAHSEIEAISARHTVRRIDRKLKKISIGARDQLSIAQEYQSQIADVNPEGIFQVAREDISSAIQRSDLLRVLSLYDNKNYVLARVAARLGLAKASDLRDKLSRMIAGENSLLKQALIDCLPSIGL